MTTTVYTKKSCVQCNATIRAMDKKGYEYGTEDATGDVDLLEFVKSLGHMQAPVVVVRDETGAIIDHWSGFNDEKIAGLAETLAA